MEGVYPESVTEIVADYRNTFFLCSIAWRFTKASTVISNTDLCVMGSNCIPIPGGMGVTDYLMLKGYQQLMSREAAFQLEMLSRGLSFYVCIFVSLTAVLIGYVTIKRKKKLENENDRIL